MILAAKTWTHPLHYDDLAARVKAEPSLGPNGISTVSCSDSHVAHLFPHRSRTEWYEIKR